MNNIYTSRYFTRDSIWITIESY